jgi:hypothetical protein
LAGARSTAPATDGFALGDTRVDLRFVEVEANLAQAVAHAQRAVLAVGEEVGQPGGHGGARVVDFVAEDVQFAGDQRVGVHGGDLHRCDDAHAVALARVDRLGDAADGVVVRQREQLHAGLRCALDHLRGGQDAVGVS